MASILKVDTIQDQAGNNIINESANTITIGASGDTITIPSGATFASVGIDDNATSTAITIDSSENVGIGTNSPSALYGKLTVAGGVSIADDNSAKLQIGRYSSGAPNSYIKMGANSNSLIFTNPADSADLMTIDSSGNVGIGTSSPTSPLMVQSNEYFPLHVKGANIKGILLETTDGETGISVVQLKNSAYTWNVEGGRRANTLTFYAATVGGERMCIDGSGNVGIGTSSPNAKLHVNGLIEANGSLYRGIFGGAVQDADMTGATGGNGSEVQIQSPSSGRPASLTLGGSLGNNESLGVIGFYNSGNTNGKRLRAYIRSGQEGATANEQGARMVFSTASNAASTPTERMRIDSSGNVLIGTTNTAPAGITTGSGVKIAAAGSEFARQSNVVLSVNRAGTDGDLVQFRHQGTTEGTISVSGSTVSYGGFTGTHWSRFQDNSTPTILKGTVLETLDEMCDWYNLEFDVTTQDDDGNDVTTTEKVPHVLLDTQSNGDVITYNHEGTDVQATIVKENDVKHMKSKVSDTVDAKNVYGVFVAYDLDGEGYNDFYVASVGSFVVRIKANETIAKGDLLQSNGDGTAKVQTDDAVRSNSFAKVLSTTIIETYEDGSYLVPCSLMC